MHEDPVSPACLHLGTLVYQGSPTEGSVIVYSSVHHRWGRVPMQDVSVDMGHPLKRLVGLLRSDGVAQCMLLVMLLALMLAGIGGYGFSKNQSRYAAQPRLPESATTRGVAPSVKGLAMQGAQAARRGAIEPTSF
jgi:hypothetical protein